MLGTWGKKNVTCWSRKEKKKKEEEDDDEE